MRRAGGGGETRCAALVFERNTGSAVGGCELYAKSRCAAGDGVRAAGEISRVILMNLRLNLRWRKLRQVPGARRARPLMRANVRDGAESASRHQGPFQFMDMLDRVVSVVWQQKKIDFLSMQ